MRTSYMPAEKVRQVGWSNRFAGNVGPRAREYGIPENLMAEFVALDADLRAAWEASENEATRTRGVIAHRDAMLRKMRALAAKLVGLAQNTPGVTDQMKIDAGLTVYRTHRSPSPRPKKAPFLEVESVNGRTVTLRLRADKARRGRPPQVTGATVFTHVGHHPPEAPEGWRFHSNPRKTTIQVEFPPSHTGDTVWFVASWRNSLDQDGPRCQPLYVNLPAGSVGTGDASARMTGLTQPDRPRIDLPPEPGILRVA